MMVNDKDIADAIGNLKNVLTEKKLVFTDTQTEALVAVADFWIAFHKTAKFIAWFWTPAKWLLTSGGIYVTFKSGGLAEVLRGFFK